MDIVGAMIAYRKSWFDEVGSPTFPDTWEKYREVGKKLKAGPADRSDARHTFGDAPTFSYPYLWSWGGTEIEKDGKTVNINKKEVIDSVKFMTASGKKPMTRAASPGTTPTTTARSCRKRSAPRSTALRSTSSHCAIPTSTSPRRARS
jgi:ABC-type sugar transport system, periplasmic component